jgi:type VI protein secretion system component Hcp
MFRLYKSTNSVKVQLVLIVFAASAPALAQASAASSVLTIATITGESQVVPGGIDLLSYSVGVTLPTGVLRATFNDFAFVANTSSASPALLLGVATGRSYPTATLYVQRTDGGQQQYLTYTLSNVSISNYQPSNQSGVSLPTEQFALRYTRIAIEYHVINPDGSLGPPIVTCYDVAMQRTC